MLDTIQIDSIQKVSLNYPDTIWIVWPDGQCQSLYFQHTFYSNLCYWSVILNEWVAVKYFLSVEMSEITKQVNYVCIILSRLSKVWNSGWKKATKIFTLTKKVVRLAGISNSMWYRWHSNHKKITSSKTRGKYNFWFICHIWDFYNTLSILAFATCALQS